MIFHGYLQGKFGADESFKFDQSAKNFLNNYEWRGNVRELQNFVERMFVYYSGRRMLTEADIKELFHGLRETGQTTKKNAEIFSLGTIDEITEAAIQEALERFDGNRTKAAKHLGVSRSFLWRKLNNG